MNQAFVVKCHCGKMVVKIRIEDAWFTLCDVCYKDSLPNLSILTHEQLSDCLIKVRTLIGEEDPLVKKFVKELCVEQVWRRF